MEKNLEITNYYRGLKAKTTKTSRINATRRKIQSRIDDLKDLSLIHKLAPVKSRKNKVMTPLYCYSDYGKMLARIVKTMGKSATSIERRDANKKIYHLLESHFTPKDDTLPYMGMSKHLFKRAF